MKKGSEGIDGKEQLQFLPSKSAGWRRCGQGGKSSSLKVPVDDSDWRSIGRLRYGKDREAKIEDFRIWGTNANEIHETQSQDSKRSILSPVKTIDVESEEARKVDCSFKRECSEYWLYSGFWEVRCMKLAGLWRVELPLNLGAQQLSLIIMEPGTDSPHASEEEQKIDVPLTYVIQPGDTLLRIALMFNKR